MNPLNPVNASAQAPSSPSFDALMLARPLPRIEARALLERASGRAREWLIAHGDESAGARVAERFDALAARRLAGEPLAYLLGEREFFGRGFAVTPDVLIPRPDTEVLVQWAIDTAPRGARVLDLGTGSGAIAITVALERRDLSVVATDASHEALETARRNAVRLGAPDVRFLAGDWYAALDAGERFDLILSNPPYIAADDPHLAEGDLRFEPRCALTDGADGLSALRRIVDAAPHRLRAGGWLALEHGWTQAAAVRDLLSSAGFEEVRTLADAQHRDRISLGRRPRQTTNQRPEQGLGD